MSRLAIEVVELLARTGHRLVLAESCTGGLVSTMLTGVPGVSQYFCGSAVTYRESTKQVWLGVAADTIAQQTAVCADVAKQMAIGVRSKTPEATMAASITGHLGPNAPDGFDGKVFVGIAAGDHWSVAEHQLTSPDRHGRQHEAAGLVLEQLRRQLTQMAELG